MNPWSNSEDEEEQGESAVLKNQMSATGIPLSNMKWNNL